MCSSDLKPENKALPIVMLTTEGDVELVKRAKLAGAVGWIVKPFNPNRLVETVNHLTREPESQPRPVSVAARG